MNLDTAVGLVALGWLIGSLLLMAQSIRRGRRLVEVLAARHPDVYDTLGRPCPGYFDSARRTRFAQFVGRREFEQLADGFLVAEFERYRQGVTRLVVSVLATGAVVAALALALRHAA